MSKEVRQNTPTAERWRGYFWGYQDIPPKHPKWRIPGEKMKAGGLHVVPLSTQALMILRELHPLTHCH